MTDETKIFRRMEKKYQISEAACASLMQTIGQHLTPDSHGHSTICNLYLDTPDFRLIRQSMDARVYKEKLRLRSYGTPESGDRIFVEIKKKYKGIVYKRRESMTAEQAMRYLETGEKPFDSQILREIDYALAFYGHPQPAAAVCYERDAFYSREDSALRITFDRHVRYRTCLLSLSAGDSGKEILPDGRVLMEIKTGGAVPLWLADALDSGHLAPAKYSKYGSAYIDLLTHPTKIQVNQGDDFYASAFSVDSAG